MPIGPNGEKRPAGQGACAITVAKISTGEIEETTVRKDKQHGGRARAAKLSPSRRSEIAKQAAKARWGSE